MLIISDRALELLYQRYTWEKFHSNCITTHGKPIIDIFSFYNRSVVISEYSITWSIIDLAHFLELST